MLILPALYIPYSLLNTFVIVERLGCGCSGNAFNANRITLLFWFAAALIVTAVAFFQRSRIGREGLRVVYALLAMAVCAGLGWVFTFTMRWR